MPRLKAMTWNLANQESTEVAEPVAVINLKVITDALDIESLIWLQIFE